VRDTELSFYLKIAIFYTLLFIASSAIAQNNNFKPNQIIDIGGGQKLRILKCKGEGSAKECEVIQLVNDKQVGNPFWLVANKIHPQGKAIPARAEKVVTAKKVEEKKAVIAKNIEEEEKEISKTIAKLPKTLSVSTFIQKEDTVNRILSHKYYSPPAIRIDSIAEYKLVKKMDTSKSEIVLLLNDTAINNTNITEKDSPKNIKDTAKSIQNKMDLKDKKLAIFIDCHAYCDESYLKSSLPIVDFVISDRTAADVHVLINQQNTGGGGKALQMIFYGQGKFMGNFDTLVVNLSSNSTDYEQRVEMLKGIKAGLVPYLFKANYSKYLDIKINLSEKEAQKQLTATSDKWDYWVFGLGANGTLNSEQVYKDISISGDIFANRITDKLKLIFQLNGSYYKLNGSYSSIKYEVLNKDYSAQHSLIASIGNHWGIGYTTAYTINTFSNNKGRIYGKAGIEYSIFPYKDVNTRLITISYGLDIRANKYFDTTIYFKTRELLFGHSLQTYFSFTQRWGNFNSLISYSNFLKDFSLNNLSARLSLNFRITGGLFFNIYASGSRVRDQVYLKKGTASEQDVLTRRLQLASEYNFYSGGGLNFRFGSKLNNFVNPRLNSL
jgi:hypothetical protein